MKTWTATLPGFSAEAALTSNSNAYRQAMVGNNTSASTGSVVYPQNIRSEWSENWYRGRNAQICANYKYRCDLGNQYFCGAYRATCGGNQGL